MRVYVYPADLTGCGFYRLIWATRILIQRGYDVKLVMPKDRENQNLSLSAEVNVNTGELEAVRIPEDADVMVFQRVTHTFLAKAIPLIRAGGTAVVVEIDDDLSALDPSNPAFHAMHPRRVKSGKAEHSWKNTELACRDATLVMASTPALRQRYGRHGRFAVVQNCIPESYLSISHEDQKIVGWAGGLFSHRPDLIELGPTVQRLVDDGYAFTHIGGPEGVKRVLQLRDDQEITQPGNATLERYPYELTQLGVGLAPLKDTAFNASKSWLKPLEYASVGVVPVMSPRAEYREIARRGIGVLASNARAFYAQTKRLLDDAGLRQEESLRVRELAAEMTYEKHATEWWDAWTHAYEIQQAC